MDALRCSLSIEFEMFQNNAADGVRIMIKATTIRAFWGILAVSILSVTSPAGAKPDAAISQAAVGRPQENKTPDPLWVAERVPWIAGSKHFFVAPDGKEDNAGTKEAPWDLVSALNGRHDVPAGSVIWLRGGTYGKGGNTVFTIDLKGTQKQPIIVRQYPTEHATINGGIKGRGAWTWLWGFEIKNSDPNRKLTRKGKPRGVDVVARGLKCINLIIHDTSGATTQWKSIGDQGELHGCIFWGNGVYDPTFARGARRGGGTYAQNKDGTRYFTDVISFRNFASGLYAGSSGQAHANGFHVEGNVLFDNYEWGFLITSKKYPIERLKLISNFTYWKRGTKGGKGSVMCGYSDIPNRDVELRDNYFVLGPHSRSFLLKKFSSIVLTGNTVIGPGLLLDVTRGEEGKFEAADNRYFEGSATPFRYEKKDYDFAGWLSATSTDNTSKHVPSYPKGVRVFVRPNKYERGRGHIIVYNWDKKSSVQADVSSVLTKGAKYEIRDAQNYFGKPVCKGTFDGRPVKIPMNQTRIARPIGQCPHIEQYFRHTAPEFGVFVIITEPTAGDLADKAL